MLIPLFDDVVLLEPVDGFIAEARRAAGAGEWRELPAGPSHMSLDNEEMRRRRDEATKGRHKRVWFVKGGLQGCNPAYPAKGASDLGVVGEAGHAGSGGISRCRGRGPIRCVSGSAIATPLRAVSQFSKDLS